MEKFYLTIFFLDLIFLYINNDDNKGKNICPLFMFIWFTTMLNTVAYLDSNDKDQWLGNILS